MKLLSSIFFLGALTCMVSAQLDKCVPMEDPSSTLQQTMTLDSLKGYVVKAGSIFPADLSKCIGSTDVSKLLTSISSGIVGKCGSLPQTFEGISELVKNAPGDVEEAIAYVKSSLTNSVFQQTCTDLESALSCTNEAIPFLLNFIAENSDEACCGPVFANIQEQLGTSLDKFIAKVLSLLKGTVCSVRTPGLMSENPETCGYSMVQSILTDVSDLGSVMNVLVPKVKASITIPNGEGCKAYSGQVFTNTNGDEVTALQSNPIDSCSTNLDAIVTAVRNIPAVQSSPVLQDLFADDKSVEGSAILSAVETLSIPEEMKTYVNYIGGALFDGEKIHLANGFSKNCDSFVSVLNGSAADEVADQSGEKKEPKSAASRTMTMGMVPALFSVFALILA